MVNIPIKAKIAWAGIAAARNIYVGFNRLPVIRRIYSTPHGKVDCCINSLLHFKTRTARLDYLSWNRSARRVHDNADSLKLYIIKTNEVKAKSLPRQPIPVAAEIVAHRPCGHSRGSLSERGQWERWLYYMNMAAQLGQDSPQNACWSSAHGEVLYDQMEPGQNIYVGFSGKPSEPN